jgi:flagellar basal-body rod protein FlgC
MINAMDVSTSALIAQRTRLNAISANIANISTLTDENGKANPYQARFTVFETDENLIGDNSAPGVKVSSVEVSDAEPLYRYQPEHPLAIKDGKWKGYVAYPNINLNEQMVDALEATRSYEANVGVMEITKGIGRQSLSIIA